MKIFRATLLATLVILSVLIFREYWKYSRKEVLVQYDLVGAYEPPENWAPVRHAFDTDKLLALVNDERTARGLKPLVRNERLDKAALLRVKAIVEFREFSHEATRSHIDYLIAESMSGYSWDWAGENLAKDQASEEEMVRQWMSSKLHRENILNPHYEETGIAGWNLATGEQWDYFVGVQLFGSREAE